MQKFVNLVDLAKSFRTSVLAKFGALQTSERIWLRYSRERASQSLPKISQKLEWKLEKTWLETLSPAVKQEQSAAVSPGVAAEQGAHGSSPSHPSHEELPSLSDYASEVPTEPVSAVKHE